MRKKLKLIIFTILINTLVVNVFAAGSAALSVNKSTIENGSTVTASVTVRNTAAWNIKINSSGVTSGCSQSFVGDSGTGSNTTKTFSVTCKSTSTGIIRFSMSGDITSSDGVNSKISGSKSVTVTVPREKSTNNLLKSLSVADYELSPGFDKKVNEYSVTVPSTVEKITINATLEDRYASVSGTGEQVVEEGINTFEVIVTSETGVENIYTIKVTVEDINPIDVTIGNKKYTVIKVAKNLTKPELFDETTIKIGEFEVPAFKNEASDITLVGLKDEKGNIVLAIYKDGKYELYNELLGSRLTIMPLNYDGNLEHFFKTKIEINNIEVDAFKLKEDSRFAVIYGKDISNGKNSFYMYDEKDKTIMLYNDDLVKELDELNNNYFYALIAFGGGLLLSFICIIYLGLKNKKKKSKKKNKEKIKITEPVKENNKEVNENKIVEINDSEEEVYDIFEDDKKKKKRKKK